MGNVDFVNRCLKWGKVKTSAGTGRVVPLNQRATATLEFWATSFPKRQAHHYVFPAESYGGGTGKADVVSFNVDPEKPIGSIKEAWDFSKKRAGLIMAGLPPDSKEKVPALQCRFHDLRHTAITRMRNNGTPIEKIAKIVGWSTGQMVRMAALYGHYSLDDLREAVENIGASEVAGSPVISQVRDEDTAGGKPN